MQRTKAERAAVVAAIMARRADMGLYRGRPVAQPRQVRTHAWHRAKDSAAAESRARKPRGIRPSPLTPEQWEEARRLRTEERLSYDALARMFGCGSATIKRKLGRDGIRAREAVNKRNDPELAARVFEYNRACLPTKDIKAKLGISLPTYYRILREHEVDPRRKWSNTHTAGQG